MGVSFGLDLPYNTAVNYSIRSCEFGIIVSGSVPVTELVALMKVWSKMGMKTIAPGVATALGASFAITKNVEAWANAIEAEVAQKYPDNPELQWLMGTKTGTSSLAMFSVLARPELRIRATARLGDRHNTPSDADDFLRCSHMVYKLGFENRLEEVSAKWPEWKPIVDNWNQLMQLEYEFEGTPKKPKVVYEKAWIKFNDGFKRIAGSK